MVNGGLMATAVVLGFLVMIGIHWYYPQNALSQIVEQATLSSSVVQGFAIGSVISFSVGILIEYSIVVLAIYLFMRSIVKSFEKRY